ncbi:SIR2 family protein [Bacteroides gallinaceum]|uniref:SIR2 family protein n=1 Tax=Bacteroides gallinaceum TaxID=1462571 RepID=UPI00195AB2A1|nr:SIR2 family protein [Bacteroides gallinaceum]MBM6944437.1 SIR2 family protein [Bacteroides gallinaceum]
MAGTEIIDTERKLLGVIIKNLHQEEPYKLYSAVGGMFVDLYLPNGCKSMGIPSNTAIEYKNTLLFDTIYRCKKTYQAIINNNQDAFNFYLVYGTADMPEDGIRQYENDNFKVVQVKKLIGQKSAYKVDDDWKEVRNNNINKAKGMVESRGVVLFLGAGVSIGAGLPSWDTLLQKLLDNEGLDGNGINYNCIDEKCFHSSIIIARYIRESLEKSKRGEFSEWSFTEALRDALWDGYAPKRGNRCLINTIAEIIKDESRPVNSVITYNYDDLLERTLGEDFAQPIGKDNDIERNKFPIYHVHGILPYTEKEKVGDSVASTAVISEDDYHKLYEKAFHWSNVEQLHALQRCTCFFIGFSMSDPNLRRMLDTTKTNDERHFVFLRRGDFSICNKFKNKENMRIQEQIMNKLGLNVIWFEAFEELPVLLEQIFLKKNQVQN